MSLAFSSVAPLNYLGRTRFNGSAGLRRRASYSRVTDSMPVCSLACWRNNASDVVVLDVASGHVPYQAKHCLKFVPVVFAHVFLVFRSADPRTKSL